MNRLFVAARGGEFLILGLALEPRPLSRSEALNLAAWLVVMADEGDGEFERELAEARAS